MVKKIETIGFAPFCSVIFSYGVFSQILGYTTCKNAYRKDMDIMNHLKYEQSPYLLQHAENPVDWYPWCEEAFEEAAGRNVPVFLSIGYSTCHWCHVMAKESFADNEIAEILNKNFVSVKVDREERPDIDSVYMTVCRALTGSGGWPLTIIMTPDKMPFFAGTYFPKHSRKGAPGLNRLLPAIAEKWTKDQAALTSQSTQIVSFLKSCEEENPNRPGKTEPQYLTEDALAYYCRSFDKKNGGFGGSPKFPTPHNLLFLMAQKGRKGDKYLAMAEKTLQQMYRGGIFDHIGGGFCRYSTDDMWLAPHFEKMLYDNALLLLTYSQAAAETGNRLYRSVCEKIAAYVRRELTDQGGGFYCGQDADSDGEEGLFYLFTPEEIRSLLHLEPAALFCSRYDITAEGNFEGKSIPNLLRCENWQQFPDEDLLRILCDYRLERTILHCDDKILTGWNGLMIAALARSARQLKKADFLESALQASDFIWEQLRDDDGRLLARWRQGHRAYPGTLEDYAFFIWGLLECYSTTFNPTYLERADLLGRTMLALFFDSEQGGGFLYANDGEQLFLRPKETFDGAIPSGNAVMDLVIKKLAFFTGEDIWEKASQKQSQFMAAACSGQPAGHSFYLWSLSLETEGTGQLIITAAADESGENLPPDVLCQLWDLNVDILLKSPETAEKLHSVSPFTENYPLPDKGFRYYFCKDHVCRSPVETLEELEGLL